MERYDENSHTPDFCLQYFFTVVILELLTVLCLFLIVNRICFDLQEPTFIRAHVLAPQQEVPALNDLEHLRETYYDKT